MRPFLFGEKMKFIDIFAGIGGFRSGLERAGNQCVGYIEWDKFARKSYQAIYKTKGEYTAHDIQQVKGVELPEADIWTFGSPCQDISIAGRQEGLIKGAKSSMFFEVIRCLKERIGGRRRYLPILSWKMLRLCYPAMEGGILQKSCLKWEKSGTMLSGQFSTLPMSSLKTEKESILSDILEEQVPDKYFLSKDKVKALLKQE